MISRAEFLYIKKKVTDLENMMFEFEMKSETYRMWKKWNQMNEQKKQDLQEKWVAYYQKCRDSVPGQRFEKIRLLYKEHPTGYTDQIKSIVQESHNDKEFRPIPLPSTIDPMFLKMAMNGYFEIGYKIKKMKEVVEEYSEVYGTKKPNISELSDLAL